MKITISGAQCTGKSTLIKRLFQDNNIKSTFQLRDETTRNVLRDEFDIGAMQINENGTDNTQLLICSQHLINSVLGDQKDTIYDRCALDGIVYTHYLWETKQVSKRTLNIATSIFENIQYDVMFYIPPEFPLIDDGERSINTEFRDRIVQIFENYIQTYNIPIIQLNGSVEERYQQFKQFLIDKEIYDNDKFRILRAW